MHLELTYAFSRWLTRGRVLPRAVAPPSPQQLRASWRSLGCSSSHQQNIQLSRNTMALLVNLGLQTMSASKTALFGEECFLIRLLFRRANGWVSSIDNHNRIWGKDQQAVWIQMYLPTAHGGDLMSHCKSKCLNLSVAFSFTLLYHTDQPIRTWSLNQT